MKGKTQKNKYYLVNKPYGMLSQFSGEPGDLLLGDLAEFPKDVYPVGRLDKDSEGLLLLTNDNILKSTILEPKNKTPKSYFVQVEGDISDEAIAQLSHGTIEIKHNGKAHRVAPASVQKIDNPDIPERSVPIRFRKTIPTSWIVITISEGKNRQVRKMTAAVGFPTLRLIRVKIGHLSLENLKKKNVAELSSNDIQAFLK